MLQQKLVDLFARGSGTCILDQFAAHLRAADKAEKTIANYLADLRLFARWFAQTNNETMTPEVVTPIDLREYRAYLLNVRKLAPASINRKLAALRAFLAWARGAGLIEANPAEGIRGVREQELAPRWLEKTEQYALLRAVQKEGKVRDIAVAIRFPAGRCSGSSPSTPARRTCPSAIRLWFWTYMGNCAILAHGDRSMKLADVVSRVAVDPRKLSEYALDSNNPVGRHKARVFERALGFTKKIIGPCWSRSNGLLSLPKPI